MSERVTFLVLSDFERLEEWCAKVRRMLRATPYLVGSVLTSADYRDVDVRVLLTDATFDRQFGRGKGFDPVRVRFLNRALSVWGRAETGLLLDVQVQRQTEANAAFPNNQRQAMGIRDWRRIRTSGVPAAEKEAT